jgi:hypothetical protein
MLSGVRRHDSTPLDTDPLSGDRKHEVSVTYRIDSAQKVVFTTYVGEVTDQEFLQHARDIEGDPKIHGSFVEMIHAETTSMAGVTIAGARKTATALCASNAIRKIAIVASQDVEFGFARMITLLADESQIEVQAFRAQADARSWLGIG